MTLPRMPLSALWTGLAVAIGLLGLHLAASQGTGTLSDAWRSQVAITPATTMSHWWRHLVAGFFHKSWGHLAYNLAVFAVAFAVATRQMSPTLTLANAYWIGPFVVFTLHLLVVLPLANAGVPYAKNALDYPLVGFSVMAYSIAGAAFTQAPTWLAATFFAALVTFEVVLAFLSTGPFIFLYHLSGFALGYWVRKLWLM